MHYSALLEFYKEFDTCNVPQRSTYECDLPGMGENGGNYHYNGTLGRWLHDQRQLKKGKNHTKVTSDRLAQLQILVDEGKFEY